MYCISLPDCAPTHVVVTTHPMCSLFVLKEEAGRPALSLWSTVTTMAAAAPATRSPELEAILIQAEVEDPCKQWLDRSRQSMYVVGTGCGIVEHGQCEITIGI